MYLDIPLELHKLMTSVVLTSLTHPREILLVVLQTTRPQLGKAKDLSAYCSAYSSTMNMEVICFPKLPLTFKGLHGVISQKAVLFITTGVRT
jgi:hypothetical protein